MANESDLDAAYAKRRAVLGDAYVDSQTAETNPTLQEFQDHITMQAWGVWAREGALSTRDRSLLTLAITAALGRMDEFKIHVGARRRAGVSDAEIEELLFQLAAYGGGPAGLSAKRALAEVRAAEAEGDGPA